MNLSELWNSGIELSEAAEHFSPQSLQRQFMRAKKSISGKLKNLAERKKSLAISNPNQKSLYFISGSISDAAEIYASPNEFLHKMRDHLLAKLKSGDCVAVGFAIPRKSTDDPHKIPIDLFEHRNQYLDWEKSSIKGKGLEFASVRVVPGDILALAAAPNPATPIAASQPAPYASAAAPRKPGRPNASVAIEKALSVLDADGRIDWSASMTRAAGQIIEWLNANQDELTLCGLLKAPGYEAIRRVIASRFNANKRSSKLSSKL